ncbi:MAG: A/G-specific adenine glycosylase [Planctomycetota bacterium]
MPRPPFAKRLLDWYGKAQRDLPWRHQRDPWAIWVSEIMLQQTRVDVVRRHYPEFLARFPGPADLAQATDDELLAAWRGLGYYRRAKLLREGAQAVVTTHKGRVPNTLKGLMELPGVGEYTAGAIASIAFGRAVTAVDGNVERVAARHRAIEGNVKRQPAAQQIREVVEGWLPDQQPGDFNQALMELGAVICTPRTPSCQHCPVADDCEARARDATDEFPQLPQRRRAVDLVSRAVLVPVSRGRVLAMRIPDDEVNAGQIDLPGPGVLEAIDSPGDLQGALERRFGVQFRIGGVVTTVLHSITHHRIRLIVHQAECSRGPGPNLMAVRPDDARLPWTTTARKAFSQAALFLAARE